MPEARPNHGAIGFEVADIHGKIRRSLAQNLDGLAQLKVLASASNFSANPVGMPVPLPLWAAGNAGIGLMPPKKIYGDEREIALYDHNSTMYVDIT
jgi:hypothetical protein